MSTPGLIDIPVPPGELLDRLTILTIKRRHIINPEKLNNINREWAHLHALRQQQLPTDPQLEQLIADLEVINQTLWDIEDAIRAHEQRQDFGPAFVDLARQVYLTNDRRSRLKQQIDSYLHSPWREEKSYVA